MMKSYILNNGMSVLLHHMPNTHSVTLGLYVKAGSGYNEEVYGGITHFLEHLHFRRAGKFSQNELYYKMESMGSTLRAATYRDFMKFTMKIIPQNLMECLEIFCNLIEACEWSKEEFEKERQVVLNQILENEKYISVEQIVRENVFKGHNLANEIMGSADSVETIKIEDIQKYKARVFHSGNILFVLQEMLVRKYMIVL